MPIRSLADVAGRPGRSPRRVPTWFVGALLLGSVLPTRAPLSAQSSEQGVRSITLDSRLLTGYSARGARRLTIELADLGTWPGDHLLGGGEPGLSFRNAAHALSVFVGGTLVGVGGQLGFHELGHANRAAAVGYRPYYGRGSARGLDDLLAARRGGDLTTGWLRFTLGSVLHQGGGGYTAAFPDDVRFPVLTGELDEWEGAVAMGGLNFEMLLTEGVEERALLGSTSTGLLALYASSKLAARDYALGTGALNDMANILGHYQAAGIPVTHADVRRGSLLALLGSGLFYETAVRFAASFAGGVTRFEALRLAGFTLPNTSYYLNVEGTTFRVTSSWRSGRLVVPFGMEFPQSGDAGTEYSVGAHYAAGAWSGTVLTYLGQGFGADLDGQVRLTDGVWATAGYARIDRGTLTGARVVADLREGRGHEWHLGVRFRLP